VDATDEEIVQSPDRHEISQPGFCEEAAVPATPMGRGPWTRMAPVPLGSYRFLGFGNRIRAIGVRVTTVRSTQGGG